MERMVKYFRSAVIWLLLTVLIFMVLMAFLLGDTALRVKLSVILLAVAAVLLLLLRHNRQNGVRAYEAFLTVVETSETVGQNAVAYGCAIPKQTDLLEPGRAYCPLYAVKWSRQHGYHETVPLDDLYLILELADGSPRVRVDLPRAFFGAKGGLFQELPDRLRFDFKAVAGGDAVTVKRMRADLECDKVYDIIYRQYRLRLLVYRDSSKKVLLSKLKEL